MKLALLAIAMCAGCAFADEIKTNLPVTITSMVVTNVIEGNNQQGCGTCEMLRKNPVIAIYHPFHNAQEWKEATEKWVITNVVKHVTVMVGWNETLFVFNTDEVISSRTNRWKFIGEWRENP